jgi:hypothetical protein
MLASVVYDIMEYVGNPSSQNADQTPSPANPLRRVDTVDNYLVKNIQTSEKDTYISSTVTMTVFDLAEISSDLGILRTLFTL